MGQVLRGQIVLGFLFKIKEGSLDNMYFQDGCEGWSGQKEGN